MKLITLSKIAFITLLGSGGITTAVIFSNVNSFEAPYLKVLTKENYENIKSKQNDTKSPLINYEALPTSNISFTNILKQENLGDLNAFIITVGSQAYAQTNSMLFGQNKEFSEINSYMVNSSALMLKLYDLFYNEKSEHHNLISEYSNIQFFSFLDILTNKDISAAEYLLEYRRTKLGQSPDNANPDDDTYNASNVWKVTNPDTSTVETLPVVKSSSGNSNFYFDFSPTDAYYQFLPNNEYGTEYEKVYFRNQEHVSLFNNTINWVNEYATNYLENFSLSSQGSIVAAKKTDGIWTFRTFSYDSTIDDIISFYNPDSANDEETTS